MFKNLRSRWKVTGLQLLFVIATFALGGSLCGYIGRKLLDLFNIEKAVVWVIMYVVIITTLWPLCVVAVSIPLGQFSFFKNYLKRIFSRLSGGNKTMPEDKKINVAIFASGAGSNALAVIKHFSDNKNILVKVIITNNAAAGVIAIAKNAAIIYEIINPKNNNSQSYLEVLKKYKIDFILLAGYLKMIPANVIKAYPKKIINIHPALLPAYGGIGMYGMRVHDAVVAAKERESGITIHKVDEIYDNGEIIFQEKFELSANETADTLAAKIHLLEHKWYGKVAEEAIYKIHNLV